MRAGQAINPSPSHALTLAGQAISPSPSHALTRAGPSLSQGIGGQRGLPSPSGEGGERSEPGEGLRTSRLPQFFDEFDDRLADPVIEQVGVPPAFDPKRLFRLFRSGK